MRPEKLGARTGDVCVLVVILVDTGRTPPGNCPGGIRTSRFGPIRLACKPEAVLLTLTSPE